MFSCASCCNTSDGGDVEHISSSIEVKQSERFKKVFDLLHSAEKVPSAEQNLRESSTTTSDIVEEQGRLLDFYTVGEALGEGAFGVVLSCRSKTGSGERAVKMVDRVEAELDAIMNEVKILKKTNHHNIIQIHDVFYEKCFVCIIMDVFCSNLMVAVTKHWNEKGSIPFRVTPWILVPIMESIHHLHSNNIIHRDIKCDNFLIDDTEIASPDCHIVLTDFGTAQEIAPGERLSEKCGTTLYWSPEFYKMNYSFKADIWAVGVIMYGLLRRSFPFKGEKQVRSKVVTFSPRTPKMTQDLAKQLLARDESKRPSSTSVMAHPVIVRAKNRLAEAREQMLEDEDVEPLDAADTVPPEGEQQVDGEEMVDDHVKERREELVERLLEASTKAAASRPGLKRAVTIGVQVLGAVDHTDLHAWNDVFSMVRLRGTIGDGGKRLTRMASRISCGMSDSARKATFNYEWCSAEHALTNIPALRSGQIDCSTQLQDSSVEAIKKQLEEYRIDISAFTGTGRANSLDQLAKELQSGKASLMLDAAVHKKLVRVVDLVVLRLTITEGDEEKVLIEKVDKVSNGCRQELYRLPGSKKEPHENAVQVAERVLKQDVVQIAHANVEFDFSEVEAFEDTDVSLSYPGFLTVYRKEIVKGKIRSPLNVPQNGWSGASREMPRLYHWLTFQELDQKGIKHKQPPGWAGSSLVTPPLLLSKEDLDKGDESITKPDGSHTTVSEEWMNGDATLMHDASGNLVRVVEEVHLKLINADTGKILVLTDILQSDGTIETTAQLPSIEGLPNENHFIAARRIIEKHLRIKNNHVTFDPNELVSFEEEAKQHALPGIQAFCRRRVVTATLCKEASRCGGEQA